MVEKRGDPDSGVVNKLVLKRAVEHKIRLIAQKAFISEREAYDLIRGFFKKFINIDYEFTSEELTAELRKVYLPAELHASINSILSRVSEMEHLSRSFSKDELVQLLADFQVLVDALISSHYEKHGLLGRAKDTVHSTGKDHKNVLDESTLLNENERVVVKMNILLDNGRRWANKDIEAAKRAYQELLVIYDSLDDEKKAAYFRPVNELFALLKNKGG